MAATLVAGCSGGSAAPTPETAPALSVAADTPWFEVTLEPDGRTLQFSIGSSKAGDGPCDERFVFDTVQTAERVVVGFEMLHGPTMVEPTPRARR